MYDQDFERTKEFLKTKLSDYLISRGIKPQAHFRCLNPAHQDSNPSMVYNPKTHQVHCFGCNATYDIFSLVGIEFNLPSFKDQYQKVCQMYLGTGPNLQDKTYSYQYSEGVATATFGAGRNLGRISISKQPSNREGSAAAQRAEGPGFTVLNSKGESSPAPVNSGPANRLADQNEVRLAPGGAVFGSSLRRVTIQPFAQVQGRSEIPAPAPVDYSEYLQQCHERVGETDYFARRGISDEVIERFKLGFDPAFTAGTNPRTYEHVAWPAAVIPYSQFSYMVRNTDSTSADRIQKRGSTSILNEQTLSQGGTIFIVEGEFDALSLETLGYHAISLGGAGNVPKLLNKLKDLSKEGLFFYLNLDNDQAGINAQQALESGLDSLGIPYRSVNLSYPYKDPNEILVKAPALLQDRLLHLEEYLQADLRPLNPNPLPFNFISDAQSLLELKLSSHLYALSLDQSFKILLLQAMIKKCPSSLLLGADQAVMEKLSVALSDPQGGQECLSKVKFTTPDLKSDKLEQNLLFALNACFVQNAMPGALVLDLTLEDKNSLREVLNRLASLCTQEQISILVLTSLECASLAEALSAQHFKATGLQERSLLISTTDLKGRAYTLSAEIIDEA